MPTTPNYSFPYPSLSDAPNGPDAFEDLAEAVDTSLAAAELAAVPKTIVNAKGDLIAATGSDTVVRLPVGTNGEVLTANSSESAGVEWAAPPVGLAAADTASVATSQSVGTTGSYVDLTTAGPAVTVDVGPAGIAIVTVTARIANTFTYDSFVSFAVSGANTIAAADDNALVIDLSSDNGSTVTASAVRVLTGLTPGSTTFTAKYKAGSTIGVAFSNRRIGVVTF